MSRGAHDSRGLATKLTVLARLAVACLDKPSRRASFIRAYSPSVVAVTTARDDDSTPATSRSATLSPSPQLAQETSTPTSSHSGVDNAMDLAKYADGEQEPSARRANLDFDSRPSGADQARSSLTTESDRSLDFRELETRADENSATSLGPDYPNLRAITTSPSSFLRPGTRFHGTQQSERQVYDVSVEIKHVDLRESFLCGYLRIQDLTEDHPTLTTYFEGEIIGSKYNFITNHESWGATEKVDLSHWAKFSAFRPYQRQARKGPVFIRDLAQQENIFMRWKEHFLVPDHRVTTIRGASFEGFYYICFNQVKGEVSGIYFHSKLELKHVEDKGCFCALEFR
ncbi:unnamed protein product [Parascedosporium putredinis]|uniref:Vacuolar import and degradation protein n=1 Tax=Parascedosporium putredinis TaxID=1442378 RepID=A0A9P1GY14_9PEZI|nr:unnamed protein product [Parascedosporium putredinis]CAI7989533.1 unnamed protein product [Parascedosporium putredinis]